VNIEKLLKKKHKDSDEIWVNEFNEDTACDFRDAVLDAAHDDPMRPIVIYIDSYGGQVDALAMMIETMDEIPNPFITVAVGKAMSCGAALLSHGDIRLCGKHSRVMIHEVSGGTAGDVHDVSADAEEIKRLNRYFMGLLAKNCGIKGGYDALRKIIKNQDGRDNYMNAEQALKFGIVDGIGMPRVEKATVYQVNVSPEKTKLVKVNKPGKHKKKSDTKR
jgi:ATP-dependent Clp protease protease subunit